MKHSCATIAALALASSAALLLSGCSDTTSASDYVSKYGQDAKTVQAEVQVVQISAGLLAQNDSPGVADIASMQERVSTARDKIHDASMNILGVSDVDGAGKSGTEAWSALDKMNDALGSLRSFLDSNKPSDLSDFTSEWRDGRAWWNEATTQIWAAAKQSPAPTVDAG